jgi:uracil-DNA glycosylase family 4
VPDKPAAGRPLPPRAGTGVASAAEGSQAGTTGGLSPVPPGSGWPDDPATQATPVAASPAGVRALAATAGTLAELTARQSVCRACPRLVGWREQVAAEKRRSFAAERYWGRPVPGWGDDRPAVLIVGLAPAAHGGNRTGRIFTGDRSGDVLFGSLWRCGLAAKPASIAAGDGQRLLRTRMIAAVRCAPPANKPSVAERDACAPWLAEEIAQVRASVSVIVCLGHFAWQAIWPQLARAGFRLPRPRPAFGHGAEARLQAACGGGEDQPAAASRGQGTGPQPPRASGGGSGDVLLIGCYHPSQQNTFTGRVTEDMLDAVFQRARQQAGL